MTSEERVQIESSAERARRRGEMAEALRLYKALADSFPEEEPYRHKLQLLEETLQPMELTSAKAPKVDIPTSLPAPMTPEQEGERLYQLGDYAAAAAAYRRALQQKPSSALIQERLVELVELSKVAPANSPTDQALPRKPEPLLQALLDRIAARKRLQR